MTSTSLSKGIRSIPLRIGNMRKSQGFVVYPRKPDADTVTIQSDDCIAEVNLTTGVARWVRNKGGAYFPHLMMNRGNIGNGVETLPTDVVDSLKNA